MESRYIDFDDGFSRIASAVTLLNCNVFKYLISVQPDGYRGLFSPSFSLSNILVFRVKVGDDSRLSQTISIYTIPTCPPRLFVVFCDSFFFILKLDH